MPRSAAMVLSMPHTTLTDVLNILNEQAALSTSSSSSSLSSSPSPSSEAEAEAAAEADADAEAEGNVAAPVPGGGLFSVDPAAFDTVEATCKYNIYLQKQEDEMQRWVKSVSEALLSCAS